LLVFIIITFNTVCRASTLDRNHSFSAHAGHSSRQNAGDSHFSHEMEVLVKEGHSYESVTKALAIVDNDIDKARQILQQFSLR